MDFSGKQVVVTGGTGALGASVVSALIGAGATCTVPYVHDAEAERFPYRGKPQAALIKVSDLSEEAEVAKVYAGVKSLWASIHIAGGFAAAKITDIDKTALMAQIDSNLASCFLCCRAAVKAMLPAGNGRIVNVAARPALEPRSGAGMTAYTVAKAGVAALTMALAEEVAKDGILVNAVAPSIMDTAANRKAMPKADHAAWPKVDEVAATIVFLASPDNRDTRGAVVPVYGKS
jgi:NAD(P)-dependent dehydrogenase (short-subunit alcohol dehydrogenase family)